MNASSAQNYLPSNVVLKGMGRYGAIGGGPGVGGSTGSGRSGSPSLVGFVPNLLKGGSSARYGGMGDGSNSSTTTGGGAGSEEIQLLEKQGVSSQRMRKAEGEEGDGGKKGRKASMGGGVGSSSSSSSCQKGTSGGGSSGGGAGKGSLSSLVPHLPPRTGIPMPSPRRPRKTEGSATNQSSGGGGHRRRMVGAGGVVVGVGSSSRGYGRLNEEDAVSKGEGEGGGLMEVEYSRRRSSSTSSVPGGSSKMGQPPMPPPPSRTPPTRSSQVVSKIRLFQGNGMPVGGGGSRAGIPIGSKPSSGNTSPLLRERLGGGKYRIQL